VGQDKYLEAYALSRDLDDMGLCLDYLGEDLDEAPHGVAPHGGEDHLVEEESSLVEHRLQHNVS
jgi:hypothetical protein